MIDKIKTQLKKNSIFYNLNASYNCKKTKINYSKIVNFYKNKKQNFSFNELLLSKGFNGNWSNRFSNRKPRIFYLGTDEFQDNSGFLQSLSKFAEVSCFTKEDGSYGQYKSNKDVIKRNKQRLFKLFSSLSKNKNLPDILLMQTSAWRIGNNTLIDLKSKYKDLKIINISMDDRHSFHLYGKASSGIFGLLPSLDLALTAAPESVNWYLKENVPAIYFPEASSLDFYYPMNIKKKFDVGFVGGKYGYREEIVNALVSNNIDVECYGTGWKKGRLPLDQTNKFFNECKIILGFGTIGYCKNFYALKLRDFDAPLSGSCYVTHYNEDLISLYEHDEVVLCKDINSFILKINKLLNDNELLLSIAEKGSERAKNNHTYEKRLESLFNVLKINISY